MARPETWTEDSLVTLWDMVFATAYRDLIQVGKRLADGKNLCPKQRRSILGAVVFFLHPIDEPRLRLCCELRDLELEDAREKALAIMEEHQILPRLRVLFAEQLEGLRDLR